MNITLKRTSDLKEDLNLQELTKRETGTNCIWYNL